MFLLLCSILQGTCSLPRCVCLLLRLCVVAGSFAELCWGGQRLHCAFPPPRCSPRCGSTDLLPLVLLVLYLVWKHPCSPLPARCLQPVHVQAQPRDHHGGLRLWLSCYPV